jgi:NADP-dependent 3-hydroxy acid dehydrogenase YdfG
MNPFDVSGRRILVTGASSGFGRHFATMLAGHGATIIAAARRVDALDSLVADIAACGGQAQAMRLDVPASPTASRCSTKAKRTLTRSSIPI